MFRVILFKDIYLVPIGAGVCSQIVKMLIYTLIQRRFLPGRLLQPDGMPNLHGAVFGSFSTAVGIKYGFASLLYSVVATYSVIIIHDTLRLKGAKEKQVSVLNRILLSIDPFGDLGTTGITRVLQYRPLDVMCGVMLGVLCTYILMR
ncbi:MAG: divergent PAP2 family protein [Candidatus Krumholzibacteria bacterium]|nr:divergent PAP2 family protein [Candidatus Krumholzibacteria bacterium]